jgi:glyoxylase-like metal-dependent hydrolase (beta-lactamase superfamily II)
VLRVTQSHVNWYLLEDDDGVTIVDTGLPRHWSLLPKALGRLGRSLAGVRAVVLTHGHYDHVGFAERARCELGVPVYAPRGEDIYRHPLRFPVERPRGVATPGHTPGHLALHLPDHDAVITGDALVTLDPYTTLTGPRLVAKAALADGAQNLASLDRIAETGESRLLPGHGEPCHGPAEEAVAIARRNGTRLATC